MAPPASDDSRLVGHHEYTPSLNITIDPHPDQSLAPAPTIALQCPEEPKELKCYAPTPAPTIALQCPEEPKEIECSAPTRAHIEPIAGAPKPYYEPPPSAPCCITQDNTEIVQVIGMSFGIGVIVGSMLVYAFSRRVVNDA